MGTDEVVSGAELFSASAERVVSFLKESTPLPEWTVNRVAGGEQVHLYADDNEMLHRGMRVDWDDTYCVRMVKGAARVVPDALADADYADSPHSAVIRSYAGIPLTDDQGRVFGTLCGVGTEPLASADEIDRRLVTLMADLLSAQLTLARTADRQRQAAEIAAAQAQTDGLTGLINRRGWDLLVDEAQQRVSVFGDPVAVAVLDIDGLKALNDSRGHHAGDEMLRETAAVLEAAAQDGDQVARYGGDEFAVLSDDVPVHDLATHFGRFTTALVDAGISASIGFAAAKVGVVSVVEAFAQADSSMYAVKQAARTSAQ